MKIKNYIFIQLKCGYFLLNPLIKTTGGNVLMCGLMETFGPKQQVQELKQVTFQNSDYRVKQSSSFKSFLGKWPDYMCFF